MVIQLGDALILFLQEQDKWIKNMDLFMWIWMIKEMVIYIVQEKIHSIGIKRLSLLMEKTLINKLR